MEFRTLRHHLQKKFHQGLERCLLEFSKCLLEVLEKNGPSNRELSEHSQHLQLLFGLV